MTDASPGHPSDGAAGGDAPSPAKDASPTHVNVDVCGSASGAVAWIGSIPASSSTLVLSDVVVGPTNDAIVADQSGAATYEQHRWNEKGVVVSSHQDSTGSYVGPFWTSNVFVDGQNDLFYGMLMTGLAQGQNSQAELAFTRLTPQGTVLYSATATQAMPTSAGAPSVTVFDTGDDPGGGYHGALVMPKPQYFPPGVYCYPSTLGTEATSAQSVTAILGAHDFEWPSGGNLFVTTSVTASADLGCGTVTVPAAGGIVLAELGGGGNCIWNKLLGLPTAAVQATSFRVGGDGSLTLAVVYTAPIDLGAGSLQNKGTSSLAVARFDGQGNLTWSASFGGAGSAFTLGSVSVGAQGDMVLTSGYAGAVDLGGGPLSGGDTFVAVFDGAGHFNWAKTVTVGKQGELKAAMGPCGIALATNSPTVDVGTGPLSTVHAPMAPTIGVAALGL